MSFLAAPKLAYKNSKLRIFYQISFDADLTTLKIKKHTLIIGNESSYFQYKSLD